MVVVDDPNTAALALALDRSPNFADASGSFNQVATMWFGRDEVNDLIDFRGAHPAFDPLFKGVRFNNRYPGLGHGQNISQWRRNGKN